MFRLLIFLVAVAAAAWGLTWLADNPGVVTVSWRGVEYQVSLMLALGVVAALAVALAIVWGVLRFVFRIPSLISLAARARKRERGFKALSRGMVAVGVGDAGAASRHASEASRLIGQEPLTKLLQAQSAQLAGDKEGAVAAYNAMLDHHETHGLGLRGLHLEARRSGDHAAALQYAMRANAHAPAAWAGQAVLDDRARRGDWAGALTTVDSNAAARLIDKPTANRWRAVIKTAMAEEAMERDPKGRSFSRRRLAGSRRRSCRRPRFAGGSRRARATIAAQPASSRPLIGRRRTPTLPPPTCVSAKAIRPRTGWPAPARSPGSRPTIPKSLLTVGRAALEAHDRGGARAAIAPLLASDGPHGRPTRRVCLLMADIEEAEGHYGAVREWLGRAARAPRDKAWVADGVISDRWAPVSPSGTLDAFVWRTPGRAHRGAGRAASGRAGKNARRRGDRRASAPAPVPAPALALTRAASDRARAQLSASPGFRPRSRAAIGRHHRTGNDAARRPWPGGAGNEAAHLPIVRQQMTSTGLSGFPCPLRRPASRGDGGGGARHTCPDGFALLKRPRLSSRAQRRN